MKLPRRTFLHLAAGAAALPTVARIAWAQAYPTRPVRMIVPFPPAGSSDILARLIGPWLSDRLGQPFVIENRPGAATNIGTEVVVRAPPDGYTLLVFEASQAINATLYDKLNFVFLRDIAPIACIIRTPLVMEVHPSVPAKTVPQFIAYAKANPGKINMASGQGDERRGDRAGHRDDQGDGRSEAWGEGEGCRRGCGAGERARSTAQGEAPCCPNAYRARCQQKQVVALASRYRIPTTY